MRARASWRIVRLLVLVQAVPWLWDKFFPAGHAQPEKLAQAQALFGLARQEVLGGSWWQPLTYALIHANGAHLALNAAAILLFGARIEHMAGKKTLLWTVMFSVLAGAIAFLLLSPGGPGAARLVGSSAICFGLLALLTTLSPESRFAPFGLSGRSLGAGVILANLILALLDPGLPTGPVAEFGSRLSRWISPELFRVSHACHLGGSVAGWLAGRYLLRPRVTIDDLRRDRERRERSAGLR